MSGNTGRAAIVGRQGVAAMALLSLALAACGGGGGDSGGSSGSTVSATSVSSIGSSASSSSSSSSSSSNSSSPPAYTLAGAVSGLSSAGLVLANGSTTLAVPANATSYTLPGTVAPGTSYAISVATQPTGLTCSVANGSGTVTGNVANANVSCVGNSYSLGGSVSGNRFAGLVLANGSTTVTVAANATTFSLGTLAYGSSYNVVVQADPPGLRCGVVNGAGTMAAANVSNITVTCSSRLYVLGGSVSGLVTGNLVLANTGGAQTTVQTGGTSFSFGAILSTGDAYAVSVASAPPGLTCSVASGTGTTGTADIGNVVVTCAANAYTLGGGISGLATSGLQLQNGTDVLAVAANATTFTMTNKVAFGSGYAVTVKTQPTGRTCSIANGSGTMGAANVANVAVTCSLNSYTIGGSVTGLINSGLVLKNNGGDAYTVPLNASGFTMPTAQPYQSAYNITVGTQPAGLTCSVANGSGTMPASNVTGVAVTCSAQSYTLSGTVSGLIGSGLVLQVNGTSVPVASGASSVSLGSVAFGGAYAVTVGTQPAGQVCSVSNGTGTMPAGNVTNVSITCASNSYTLGGAIGNLTAGGLKLSNGSDTLTVAANATQFTMSQSVAFGASYNVIVAQQPTGLFCSVSNGSGTMPAGNVTSVTVSCTSGSSPGWTWKTGSNTVFQTGVFGTKGVAAAGNTPGALYELVNWRDGSGNLWLFGGYGKDGVGNFGRQNAVWKYSPSTNQWTWVFGSNASDAAANYGTKGVAAAGNDPGARSSPQFWVDTSGNVWVFGGIGVGSGYSNLLNDLWKYNPATNQWTWVQGPNTSNGAGVCGTRGTASASNQPGARRGAATWIDASGNLWLFGGVGYDCSNALVHLNDLWRYQPSTGNWTWMNGLGTVSGTTGEGSWGTKGVASASNVPSERQETAWWIDASGTFWMMGGFGPYQGAGNVSGYGDYNDLWKYNPTTNQWTWVAGPNTAQNAGVYGTQGVAAAGNYPGGRRQASVWVDPANQVWIFGGRAHDATNTLDFMNDLWKYNPSTGLWTWVNGSSLVRQNGVYGTQGVAAPGNVPGARNWAASWADASGRLWLFGGWAYDAFGNNNDINDLWMY